MLLRIGPKCTLLKTGPKCTLPKIGPKCMLLRTVAGDDLKWRRVQNPSPLTGVVMVRCTQAGGGWWQKMGMLPNPLLKTAEGMVHCILLTMVKVLPNPPLRTVLVTAAEMVLAEHPKLAG